MRSVRHSVEQIVRESARLLDPCNEVPAGRPVWRLIADGLGRRLEGPLFTHCRKDHNVRVFK